MPESTSSTFGMIQSLAKSLEDNMQTYETYKGSIRDLEYKLDLAKDGMRRAYFDIKYYRREIRRRSGVRWWHRMFRQKDQD